MKNLIAYRSSTKLTSILTFIMSLTFMIVWLPFLRAIFDGSSYQWGTVYYGLSIHGAGVNADFIFVVIQLLFYTALFFSIYWVRNRVWFYGLLIIWYFNVFGNFISEIIMNGDTMFHGDTLNVHISLTWIIIPLSLLALTLVYFVIRADRRAEEQYILWSKKNRVLLYIILGPLPVQAVLFAIGEPHGITDQIGVIMSIIQSFAIPEILRPNKVMVSSAVAN